MCLILMAYNHHKRYPLILAANRDEFYNRPTLPAGYWEDRPDILAGRDLQGLGTWLGISGRGRLAAITNYRDPASIKSDAPTRGLLVSDFLAGSEPAEIYLQKLSKTGDRYNGFNLLLFDDTGLWHYSNRGNDIIALSPGIHGLSNHLLNTRWPKIDRGLAALENRLADSAEVDSEKLLRLLEDSRVAPDDALPDTGVGIEWERMLSPMFIHSETYGTRCSSVVLFDDSGNITFIEKIHPNSGSQLTVPETRRFKVSVDANGMAN